jgi:hypothetical protein
MVLVLYVWMYCMVKESVHKFDYDEQLVIQIIFYGFTKVAEVQSEI